ncbi:MAG TPA: peptide chain release factor N(5)-glutamine methyltransferase [Acidobacteriaceae bacterium]|nr:peptide chain release factor N(5)-glutamine methyltransferase [Acidobacteriaceae bacterium]
MTPPSLARALSQALSQGVDRLEALPHLRETAARDALTLLLNTLSINRAQFYANSHRILTPEQQSTYDAAIARRLTHEPIQYITGEQEFFGLPLRVTPAVLIPRPETEHLVEAVLAELRSTANDFDCHSAAPPAESTEEQRKLLLSRSGPHILDVGTGSGAIAIALAHHLPHAHVTATDISPAALTLARENAIRNNVRIKLVESDLLNNPETVIPSEAALNAGSEIEGPAAALAITGLFDAIVSNPPYVPEADRPTLHPQVRDFEPSTALFAGPDGLAIYRRLIPQARAALTPNGLLALEIGHGQRDAIAGLLSGWHSVRFVPDLQGIPRVALARRP